MPIVFQAKADVSDVEAKLRSLPAKAQAAGRATGDALGNGMRRGTSGSTGVNAMLMKRSAQKFINQEDVAESGKAAAKKADKEKKENAKAQMALDAYNEKRAAKDAKQAERAAKQKTTFETRQKQQFERFSKASEEKADREARKMDNARARSRAQARQQEAQAMKDQEGGIGKAGLIRSALGGGIAGLAIHAAQRAMQEIADYRVGRIDAGASGFSRQQSATVRSWQTSAAGNVSKEGRADLQESMNESIQDEMDKLRTRNTDEGFMDRVAMLFGKDSTQEIEKGAMESRIGAMQLLARGSARQAQKGEALSLSMAGLSPNQQNFVLGNKLDELRDERSRLNLDDPKQLQKFQRLSAEIKGIETLRNPARENMQAQVQAATQMLGPTQKLAQLEKLRAGYVMESEKATTPLAERQKYEALATQTGIQVKQAEHDLKMRTLDVGLMGAGGRREAMRAMRREQRELNRAERIRKSGAQDARAFSKDLIDPQKGRDAALQQAGNAILDQMKAELIDINGKLAFPKLG